MFRSSTLALAVAVLLVTAGCAVSVEEAPTTADRQTTWTVTVERVVDGDTLEVEFPDGSVEDVRLLGVDTPEVHTETTPDEFAGVPDSEAGRAWLREWGERASEFARTRLQGATVRIETDPAADRRGGYGRLLVYVYHDGLFNRRLLERGYARLFDTEFGKRDAFAAAAESARESGVGLWGFERTTTGALSGRHSHGTPDPHPRFVPQRQVTAVDPEGARDGVPRVRDGRGTAPGHREVQMFLPSNAAQPTEPR